MLEPETVLQRLTEAPTTDAAVHVRPEAHCPLESDIFPVKERS